MGLSKTKEQEYIKKVAQDGLYLKRITKNQTEKICLAAVKESGWALEYVNKQTPEICLEAVKQNGLVLEYVDEQTPEICLAAVKEDGGALEFVEQSTPKIRFEAVKEHGYTIQNLKKREQNEEVCLAAFFSNPNAYEKMKKTTEELDRLALCLDVANNDYQLTPSYRKTRYELATKVIGFEKSPYHVLEQLYPY